PHFPRDWRRSYVHPRSGQRHPENFAMARKRQRSTGVGGIGCGAEQLSFLQRLHAGMPVERESGVVEGGTALRRDSKTWTWFARTDFEPARSVRPNRLRISENGECSAQIY